MAVEQLGSYADPLGSENQSMRIIAERLLEENGVKVFRSQRRDNAERKPVLRVTFDTATTAQGLTVVHTSVRLQQEMLLKRDPAISRLCTTWQRTSLDTVRTADLERYLREVLDCAVYDFLDRYHPVNRPKDSAKAASQ
jgi:hypothetical protein